MKSPSGDSNRAALDVIFNSYNDSEKGDIISVSNALFPRVNKLFSSGSPYAPSNSSSNFELDRQQRLASRIYFYRFFTLSIPKNDVADKDVDKILTSDIIQNKNSISEIIGRIGADSIIDRIKFKIDTLSIAKKYELSSVLNQLSDLFPEPNDSFGPFYGPSKRYCDLQIEILCKYSNKELAYNNLIKFLDENTSLSKSFIILDTCNYYSESESRFIESR